MYGDSRRNNHNHYGKRQREPEITFQTGQLYQVRMISREGINHLFGDSMVKWDSAPKQIDGYTVYFGVIENCPDNICYWLERLARRIKNEKTWAFDIFRPSGRSVHLIFRNNGTHAGADLGCFNRYPVKLFFEE